MLRIRSPGQIYPWKNGRYCDNWNRSGPTCRQSDNSDYVVAPLDGSKCARKNEPRHRISSDAFKTCPGSNNRLSIGAFSSSMVSASSNSDACVIFSDVFATCLRNSNVFYGKDSSNRLDSGEPDNQMKTGVEPLWAAEAERRLEELRTGKVQGIEAAEAFRKAHEALER